MKPSENKLLWKLIQRGEHRPLMATDLALLLRLRFALQAYAVTEPNAVKPMAYPFFHRLTGNGGGIKRVSESIHP